jgi:hypothetical protein
MHPGCGISGKLPERGDVATDAVIVLQNRRVSSGVEVPFRSRTLRPIANEVIVPRNRSADSDARYAMSAGVDRQPRQHAVTAPPSNRNVERVVCRPQQGNVERRTHDYTQLTTTRSVRRRATVTTSRASAPLSSPPPA